MKCTACAAILVSAAISLAVPAFAQQGPSLQNSRVETSYVEPKDPDFRPILDRLKQRRVLEQLQQFLAPLRLPATLKVSIEQCGAPFVPYRPGEPVRICYEYIKDIERLAPGGAVFLGSSWITTRDDALVGAVVLTVLHEVAHAIFDMLQIPVWGRESDAADKVSAFIMLQFGKEVAWRTITGVAWFLNQSTSTRVNFSDARSAAAARFYNILCVAYGSDTKTFGFLSPKAAGSTVYLPPGRAEYCPYEYEQLKMSFTKTIAPHIDPDLLKKVQATEWLK
jgi:hypothetical protein